MAGGKPHWPVLGTRARIVLAVLIALVPAVCLFLYHIEQDRAALLASAETRALQLARIWATQHDEAIRRAELVLAGTPAVADSADCASNLQLLAHRAQWTAALAIVTPKGAVLCAAAADKEKLALLDPVYLDTVFDSREDEISEFVPDHHGHAVAFVGLQLKPSATGEARAAVTMIDINRIQQDAQPLADGTDFGVIVMGRNRTILAAAPDGIETVGGVLGPNHPLAATLNFSTEGIASGRGDDGVDAIFGFTQLPLTGAKVVVSLPRATVLGPAEHAVDLVLAMLFIVALTAMGSAWLFAEASVLRWVQVLAKTADAFGRGELDKRAVIPASAGEFAGLGEHFNEMAELLSKKHAELSDANAELERRVAERTTDLVAAQGELLKAERLSTLGELTASVAHELNNPLGAIKNTLFALKIGAGAERLQQLDRIERCIARCNRILGGLLDYSSERRPNLRPQRFDPWLDQALDNLAPPDIVVRRALDAEGAHVAFDPNRLHLVLANLVENAVQAMAENPREERILTVETGLSGDDLWLAVSDTGPGIAAGEEARIFEPLYSTKSFGTGLGLPVVKRVVEQHDGRIAIEHPAHGARIVIRLPLSDAQRAVA